MNQGEFYAPEIETMEREKLETLQLERLKGQVKRCYEHSPFYQEKFDRAGVKPGDISSLDDLTKLPVVTKEELRREQAEHPPFGRYALASSKDLREIHPSTGTTGAPVYLLWSEQDVRNITSWTARTMWGAGIRPGDIIQNAMSYGLWVAGLAVHYGASEIGCFIVPIGAVPAERHIDYLIRVGATVIGATPSFAIYLAEQIKQRGLSPDSLSLRLGVFGGEPGTEIPSTREKIERGLGLDAFDYYGLAEIGPTFACECSAKAGIHWVEDHLLVETVNPDTMERCASGEVGVLVITHLTKEATPMIRYWTNDYARLETERCACGRTHVRTPGGILGRADDLVVYRGAKFYPTQVEKVLRGIGELSDEYRIRLTTDEKLGTEVCTVVAECLDENVDRESLQDRLRKALREELQVTPRVELVKFATLERTTFKARRLEDNRKRE